MPIKHIRLATEADRNDVNRLRTEEYNRSSEFELRDQNAILWKHGYVMGAWNGNRLVATMQLEIARSKETAEQILGVPLPNLENFFPTVVLSRAATCRDYRGFGLNSALRYYCLTNAKDVNSIMGGVYQGAPRTGVMGRIGYEFIPLQSSWTAGIHAKVESQLALLRRAGFELAIGELKKIASHALVEYEWQGMQRPLCYKN